MNARALIEDLYDASYFNLPIVLRRCEEAVEGPTRAVLRQLVAAVEETSFGISQASAHDILTHDLYRMMTTKPLAVASARLRTFADYYGPEVNEETRAWLQKIAEIQGPQIDRLRTIADLVFKELCP
jgi:hypothetical protein